MNQPDPSVDELEVSTDLTTPDAVTPPAVTGAPAGITLEAAEEMYDVKVDGKVFKVPKSELISGYQRNRDYTQKTMKLAERERAIEEDRQKTYKQVEELQAWLKDPKNLMTLYNQLVQQRGFEDPDTPVTAIQAQKMVQDQLAKERETLKQQMDAQRQDILSESQAVAYYNEINAMIKGLLETHPVLKAVDGIDALLYKDVAATDPQTFDEVKAGFAKAAEVRAGKIQALFTEQKKKAAVTADRLNKGIEPPGSAGVPAVAQPKFKMGSKDLMNQVMQDLLAAAKEE